MVCHKVNLLNSKQVPTIGKQNDVRKVELKFINNEIEKPIKLKVKKIC